MGVLLSLHFFQHLLSVVLFILVIMTGVGRNLKVALICICLIEMIMMNIFLDIHLSHIFFFGKLSDQNHTPSSVCIFDFSLFMSSFPPATILIILYLIVILSDQSPTRQKIWSQTQCQSYKRLNYQWPLAYARHLLIRNPRNILCAVPFSFLSTSHSLQSLGKQ